MVADVVLDVAVVVVQVLVVRVVLVVGLVRQDAVARGRAAGAGAHAGGGVRNRLSVSPSATVTQRESFFLAFCACVKRTGVACRDDECKGGSKCGVGCVLCRFVCHV